jgi:hypothetical protein
MNFHHTTEEAPTITTLERDAARWRTLCAIFEAHDRPRYGECGTFDIFLPCARPSVITATGPCLGDRAACPHCTDCPAGTISECILLPSNLAAILDGFIAGRPPKPRIERAQLHDGDGWICYLSESTVPVAFGTTPQRAFAMHEEFKRQRPDAPMDGLPRSLSSPLDPSEIAAWLDGISHIARQLEEGGAA